MKSNLVRAAAVTGIVLLLSTSFAFADTSYEKSALAKQQVAAQSEESLSTLSMKVFVDAHTTARIIGYDRAEIDQLKRDVQELRNENAQLRGQAGSTSASPDIEARVAALEASFASLQSTLGTIVNMLTLLLSRMQ